MTHPSRLLFLHIPKSGGISMNSILQSNYDQKVCFGTKGMWQGNLDFHSLSEAKKKSIRVLFGHFPFGIHTNLGDGSLEYFSILRSPLDRVLSAFHDVSTTTNHYLHSYISQTGSNFQRLAQEGKWLGLDNCQVRMLSNSVNAPFGTLREEDLQNAKQNIENYFPLIGTQDKFDEVLIELSLRYNWKNSFYRKLHVSQSRINAEEISHVSRDIIQECNQLDEKLYSWVSERASERFASGGETYQTALNNFRRKNTRIARLFPGLHNWKA